METVIIEIVSDYSAETPHDEREHRKALKKAARQIVQFIRVHIAPMITGDLYVYRIQGNRQ